MVKELVQIAAMSQKAAEDIMNDFCLSDENLEESEK